MSDRFPCACCEQLVFESDPSGTYWICPICGWEDDPVQNSDETYEGGANRISLRQAKANFSRAAASQPSTVSALYGRCIDGLRSMPKPESVEQREAIEVPERERE
ncbi:MAG: hypothetical protein K8S25_01635 [Alphaproteobacteria bacterium]|nr:hypothetical protein [Alphaproteobacteria bacterium]